MLSLNMWMLWLRAGGQVESNLSGQRTAGGNGALRAAARRRERRLRSFGAIEAVHCRIATATAAHHSSPRAVTWTSACLRLKLEWKSLKDNRSFKVQGAPKAPIRTGASWRPLCARTSLITSIRSKPNYTCWRRTHVFLCSRWRTSLTKRGLTSTQALPI